ncbi:GTP 3',8-cyclase MoaA [Sinimarinibacterium flocculans]|uniref:GTP 3',8-cyclase n=2 Tax=Sinimarinibacterium flocculans TaxID=985250 RepID=A0A318E3M1_9GAMM|nr:cyclic pyranopterin phosphate synthase [Sinimarinibacterium flocculans]
MLSDQHGRVKRKLRLSLTDRCNFRCSYCMPTHPVWLPKATLLTRAELLRLSRLAVAHGITNIRLTGGEPLLRADVLDIVHDLQSLRDEGLERLSMTSNAERLGMFARPLRDAGLDDLNISLDAVDADVFKALTGRGIAPVMAGIDAARAAGLPVKLNTVLIRGRNEHQILPLTEWALARGLALRFIEYMPLDQPGRWQREDVVTEADILATLRTRHTVEALPRGSEPATRYRIDGQDRVGVIATVSNPFCGTCDRIRLTATGELFTCLFAKTGTPLGARMRAGDDDAALTEILRNAVWHKQAGYAAQPGPVERPVLMYGIGG